MENQANLNNQAVDQQKQGLSSQNDSDDDFSNEIKIVLKPMNIQAIHKREVEMTVPTYQKVSEFAQTLINIMGLKDFSGKDANFLVSGKTLDHNKTFEEQQVQDGARIIFTLKRKVVNPDLNQPSNLPKKQVEQTQKPDANQKINQPSTVKIEQKPVTKQIQLQPPQQKQEEQKNQQFQEVIGVQADGTIKTVKESQSIDDLNPLNIQILIDMGYEFDLIVKALRALRDRPKYNPVGEVQKAIDWINDYSYRQEEEQVILLQRAHENQQKANIAAQEEQAKFESLRAQQQKLQANKIKKPTSVKLRNDQHQLSQVYAWGNGLQGQLGVQDCQDLQPRPLLVSGLSDVKIRQIACGANHTVALSMQGQIYFWGQYVYPNKDNEAPKYGRVLAPRVMQTAEEQIFTDIRAGSSHTLALNDQGQIYSWGHGMAGQLGIDQRQNSIEPQLIHINKRIYFKKISAGVAHSSAISVTGQLFMWGSNTGCQLGYFKEMKEALSPILFGGKIQLEHKSPKKKINSTQMSQDHEMKDDSEEQKEQTSFDIGFRYLDVVCGSSQTLAIIDKSPYILFWGNGDPIAKTYSDIFAFDKPINYDCGGKTAVVLTEKGNIYKINLEVKSIEKIMDKPKQIQSTQDQEMTNEFDDIYQEQEMNLKQIACGSDFIVCLKNDGNIYGIGQNKSGQLGTGDLKPRDEFTLIENLLNEDIKQVYAGNQHCCCIVDNFNPLEMMIREMKEHNQNKTGEKNDKFVKIRCSDQSQVWIHANLAQIYFYEYIKNNQEIHVELNQNQVNILIDLLYGIFTISSMYDWINSQVNSDQPNGYFKLLENLKQVRSYILNKLKNPESVLKVIELLELRLARISDYLISVSSELDDQQRQIYADYYRERNRILIELGAMQAEQRNREINRIQDPAAFTNFSYISNMNFGEERRRLQQVNDERFRRIAQQQINEMGGDDDDY
eukprot:403354247